MHIRELAETTHHRDVLEQAASIVYAQIMHTRGREISTRQRNHIKYFLAVLLENKNFRIILVAPWAPSLAQSKLV